MWHTTENGISIYIIDHLNLIKHEKVETNQCNQTGSKSGLSSSTIESCFATLRDLRTKYDIKLVYGERVPSSGSL
jgi:hypothetical protein